MEDLNEMQAMEPANIQPTTENVENNLAADAAVNPTAEEPTAQPEAVAPETVQDEAPKFEEPEVDYSQRSREELVEEMKALLEEDVDHIRNRAGQVKLAFNALNKEILKADFEAFLAAGGEKDAYEQREDEVALTFRKLYNTFRERRQRRQEEIDAAKQRNLEQKRALLEELRALLGSEDTMKKIHDDFSAIQDRWKAIGDVPRADMNDLWQNYHFLVEQFFNKVRMNKELRMLDLKKNLEQKIALCEKVEELIVEPSVTKAFKALQGLREQWKGVGPVPTEHNDEIWQRFCNAADKVSARHHEYFEQRREEQEKNLLAKQALVDKATELTAVAPTGTKEWNDTTAQLDELLKIWKTIGPVPQAQNEQIWNTFKGMIDNFYARKKEYFETMKDEQNDNYNKKLDLCVKAEAIAKRDDWKKATQELLQLQAEWKAIGPVSRKLSEKVWQRFRGACDEFFAAKETYFQAIRGNEQENLVKKEAILAQLKEYQFGENKEENLNVIKDFQRQWMEAGHVPMSEKDRLQKEFRGIIDDYFEKLKISAREADERAFRERLHNAGGDKKFVNDEKDQLLNKIDKLRNDLQLWENNLGFLANSKQADLLKEEFEKKMQGARQQIALLEAKLRILRETEKEARNEE